MRKAYPGGAHILKGVDFAVRRGERVALVGANGAGKSTLLKCLIGLAPMSAGTVEVLGERFEGAPTRGQRDRMRRATGFVFQRHCLVRRRSALTNVVHGLLGAPGAWLAFDQRLAPAAWRRQAMAALDEVGLGEFALRRADRLSGGQQQRVAIARAIVRRPALLIADEPAASLDPTAGRAVMERFAELCRGRGITLLFTSHDMDHARAFSDRIVALRDGVVAWDMPSGAVDARDLDAVFAR